MHTEVTCDTKLSIKLKVYIIFLLVYLTFNCDLDLELTHKQHGLYTSPSLGECVIQV